MTGIYTIYAYDKRLYKKEILGIVVPSKNNTPTILWQRLDVTRLFIEASNENEALTKAKLLIERNFYDIAEIARIGENKLTRKPLQEKMSN